VVDLRPTADGLAELVFNDSLPNGSGYCAKLMSGLEGVLSRILTPNRDTWSEFIQSSEHMDDCDESCPLCLREFRNKPFHPLLDWRLGLSMLYCFYHDTAKCGLDGNFAVPGLGDWLSVAGRLQQTLCASFPTALQPVQLGPLPAVKLSVKRRVGILVHPLWNLEMRTGLLAEAEAAAGTNDKRFLDTFNLQRRMGWSYQEQLLS